MLQFYAGLCCTESNVAHKVQRYTNLFVASEGVINTKRSITPPKELACPVEFYSTGVFDVKGFIPERIHVASTEQAADLSATNLGFPPLSNLEGIQRRISMKEIVELSRRSS